MRNWKELVFSRPAVKMTMKEERDKDSLELHIYPGKERKEYLYNVYYPYAKGKTGKAREAFHKLEAKPLNQEEYRNLIDSI